MRNDPPAGVTATADAATTADAIYNATVNTVLHTSQPAPAEVDPHGNEVFQYKGNDEPPAVVEASSNTNYLQEQPDNHPLLSTLDLQTAGAREGVTGRSAWVGATGRRLYRVTLTGAYAIGGVAARGKAVGGHRGTGICAKHICRRSKQRVQRLVARMPNAPSVQGRRRPEIRGLRPPRLPSGSSRQ